MTNIWLKALRNNYLPAFLLMMLAMSANAQVDQIYPQYGGVFKRITADSSFSFPTGCGAPSGLKRTDNNKAGLYYDSCNAKGYIYDPKLNTWGEIGSGSSGGLDTAYASTLYYRKGIMDNLLSGKANTSHTHSIANVTGLADSINKKVDTSKVIKVDTAGSQNGYEAYLDKPNNTVKFRAATGGSGGGTDSLIAILKFTTGVTPNAPAAGDSSITNAGLVRKKLFVDREGESQDSSATNGYTFNRTTGQLQLHPPLMIGERVEVHAYDTVATYNLTLESTTVSEFLNFSTDVGLSVAANVWSGSITAGYGNYGLADKHLPASTDGWIEARYTATDAENTILTFRAEAVNSNYTTNQYRAGFYISSGGIYKTDNGSIVTGGTFAAVVGNWYRVERTGSTFKLKTSSDYVNWTDCYTYSYSSTATMYVNLNINNPGKNYLSKGFNLVP